MAMPTWKMEKTLLGWAISFGANKIIASGETGEVLMFLVLLPTQEFSIEKLNFGVGSWFTQAHKLYCQNTILVHTGISFPLHGRTPFCTLRSGLTDYVIFLITLYRHILHVMIIHLCTNDRNIY